MEIVLLNIINNFTSFGKKIYWKTDIMEARSNKWLIIWILLLLLPLLALITYSQAHSLFNDTIQFGGDVPLWFYHENFNELIPPDYADSGHPPGFGLYLAALWKLLGVQLWVAHWAIFPFIILAIVQIVRLANYIFPTQNLSAVGLSVLLICQPAVSTQFTLVSPDVVVLGLALWMINSILLRKNISLACAVALVAMVSVRGMSIAVALYLVKWWYDYKHLNATNKSIVQTGIKALIPFIPGGLIGLSYFITHYLAKGWITPNETTPWGAAFELVSLSQWIKHLAVLLWRFIDLGGIWIILLAAVLVIQNKLWIKRSWLKLPQHTKRHIHFFTLAFVVLFVLTAMPLTIYKGLLTQRYLMLLSSIMVIITLLLLDTIQWKNSTKKIVVVLLCMGLITGNMWLYPATLSRSWDCSLGHFGYYPLRKEFLQFMKEKDIDPSLVITEFPMHKSAAVLDYNLNDTLSYRKLNEVDLTEVSYLWYSNVCNSLLKQKAYFDTHYNVLKKEKHGQVEMILYKKKGT